MRYCPDPSCSHRARCGSPAEYEDRAAECSDCGTPLVADAELASATMALAAGAMQAYRGPSPGSAPEEGTGKSRSDVATGLFLVAASIVITVGTCIAAELNGGFYLIAIGPFLWGMFRLMRGLRA